jgi:hypothetical protein
MNLAMRACKAIRTFFHGEPRPGTFAYERGYKSAKDDTNPYHAETREWREWEQGREDAAMDIEARAW